MDRIAILALALVLGAITLPAAAWASPILYEVLYDGQGTDADDVFTEIYGEPGLALKGWTLQGVNGSSGKVYLKIDLTGATIPSDGLLVIATTSAKGQVLSARDFTAKIDWQNGPDAIRLVNAGGKIIDALQYGDAGTYNAGEGDYAVDVSAGWSLSRDLWGTDTDDNASDFYGLKLPTPGVGPVQPVPEPATLLLVSVGALGVAGAARRRRSRS